MKKLIFFMVVVLAIAALALIGCKTTTAETAAAATTVAAATTAAATTAASETTAAATTAAPPAMETIIGYNSFSDTVAFSKKISDNLQENCDKLGIKLLKGETNGDATTALKNADSFISQGATVIIDSSWTLAVEEAIAKKCGEAKIPMISIDIPIEGGYFMGISNIEAGKTTGNAAADYIKKNWDGKIDYLVLSHIEATGEVVKLRTLGIRDAIREAGIDLPDDRVIYFDPQGVDGTVAGKQISTDFLTAHPDSTKIVFGGENDQAGLGFFSGIEASQRTKDCIVVSQGADDPAIVNLQKAEANCWIGSTAYFPEHYGNVLAEMVQSLMAGKEVPPETYVKNVFINRDNVAEYYPK